MGGALEIKGTGSNKREFDKRSAKGSLAVLVVCSLV